MAAKAQTVAQTFVLVHGAWHGGWCWSRVADRLRAAGHRVFTPTQTGLGERKHLLSKDITLDAFTKDIVNVIEAEELSSVILVGHSFGGLARTCIACTNPSYAALEGSRKWVKAQQGWRWAEIATGHDAMVMAPEELARMLIDVTSRP